MSLGCESEWKSARIAMLTPRSRKTESQVGSKVDGAGVGELLIEVKVEMADQHFVAGQGFVDVVVRKGHDGLLRGLAVVRD